MKRGSKEWRAQQDRYHDEMVLALSEVLTGNLKEAETLISAVMHREIPHIKYTGYEGDK